MIIKFADTARIFTFVMFSLLFVFLTSALSQVSSPVDKDSRVADREQITGIIRSWEKAWNSHDMRAFANLFHEDGIWVLWTGAVWKGRTAIEEGHAAVHKTIFRKSIQKKQIDEMTFTGPDAAVVRLYSTLTGDERAPDKVVRSRNLLVITKRNGVWKIGWGQNTRLADSVPD